MVTPSLAGERRAAVNNLCRTGEEMVTAFTSSSPDGYVAFTGWAAARPRLALTTTKPPPGATAKCNISDFWPQWLR
jgi:hypothetical protein